MTDDKITDQSLSVMECRELLSILPYLSVGYSKKIYAKLKRGAAMELPIETKNREAFKDTK